MKVAILGIRGVPSGYSGYETFAQELGPRLVERGHEVVVYCRRSLFPERPRTYKGMALVYLPSIQTKTLGTFSHTLFSAIDLSFRRADIGMYVNVANSPFCAITRLAGIKTALNVDGMEWRRPKWGPVGKKYFYASARMCKHTAHAVVTDAAEMKRIYWTKFGTRSTDIAYGANIFSSRHPECVRELGLTPGEYIFTVCRLVPDNNVELLVRAFNGIKTDRQYVIAGGTPYESEYVEQLKRSANANVVFLGQVNDQDLVDELYANASVYFHGHEFGGTNPTVLRALAAGNCVVALDTAFNREVLGENGLFFQKSEESAREVLEDILESRAKRELYASRSRDRIREKYTWDIIADQYEELFNDMLSA